MRIIQGRILDITLSFGGSLDGFAKCGRFWLRRLAWLRRGICVALSCLRGYGRGIREHHGRRSTAVRQLGVWYLPMLHVVICGARGWVGISLVRLQLSRHQAVDRKWAGGLPEQSCLGW